MFAAPHFQAASHFVKSSHPKRVPIDIFEACEDPSPRRLLRWKQKANTPITPFFVFCVNVFGEKENPAIAANQFVGWRIGLGRNQRKVRAAVRRRHLDPALARLETVVHHQSESKLVDIKSQAAVLIAHEHDDVVHAQIRFAQVKA